jgi:hypothetical protein
MSETSDRFYESLPPFENFSDFTKDEIFHEVPLDWLVFISDVKGSTRAIHEGRYRDVNMIGAACIAAVQNSVSRTIPYVFGGDGASFLCPPKYKDSMISALGSVQSTSKQSFNLELRVGCVPISAVRQNGRSIFVAKYQLAEKVNIALMRGGGLALAEDLIKKGDPSAENFQFQRTLPKPDLSGLSCRFMPFRSLRGVICSILIRARDEDSHRRHSPQIQDNIYSQIIQKIEQITGMKVEDVSPVQSNNMSSKWPPPGFRAEVKVMSRKPSEIYPWIRTIFRTLLTFLLMNYIPRFGPFKPKQYQKETLSRSDYKKFDDMLRLVIDFTSEEVKQFTEYLQDLQQNGVVDYGIHQSSEALMTCFLYKASEGEHIHFIDGNNGGYALAARDLKAQMNQRLQAEAI